MGSPASSSTLISKEKRVISSAKNSLSVHHTTKEQFRIVSDLLDIQVNKIKLE